MDLRQLRYFLAVVDEQGFRAASRALHVSQPPVTRAVHELEAELGVTLVERDKDGARPTRAGKLLVRHARAIVAAIERARVEVTGLGEAQAVVRVGHVLPEYLVEPRASRALALLRRKATIEVAPVLPRGAGAAIREGAIDLAFVFLPFEHDEEALVVLPVLQDELVAALPAGHALARAARVSLALLAKEPLLLFPRKAMPERHDEILGHFARGGLTPKLATVGPSLREALTQVGAGRGVSLVPRRASEVHADLPVVLRPVQQLSALWTLAAVLRGGDSGPARALVRALQRIEGRAR